MRRLLASPSTHLPLADFASRFGRSGRARGVPTHLEQRYEIKETPLEPFCRARQLSRNGRRVERNCLEVERWV